MLRRLYSTLFHSKQGSGVIGFHVDDTHFNDFQVTTLLRSENNGAMNFISLRANKPYYTGWRKYIVHRVDKSVLYHQHLKDHKHETLEKT